jgi:hypothetical protein
MQAGFDPRGSLAFGNGVREPLDILALDGGNCHAPEQGLYVPLDPPAIGGERAGLLGYLAPSQQSARLGVGEVKVTQFGDRFGLARRALLGRWIGTLTTSPNNSRAFSRALSGVHGEPCRPILYHRCRLSALRYLTR